MIALLLFTSPFQDITLPSGSVASYVIEINDPNKGKASGPFYFEGEPSIPDGTKWAQALVKGDKGWHDGTFPVVDGKIKLDKEQSLGSPVYDYSQQKFLPSYWWFWNSDPYGKWNDLVWGKAGITIRTDNSKINVSVTGCPWQSVDVIGSGNTLVLNVRPGTQSRKIMDLASVRVRGNDNRWSGYIEGEMCALWTSGLRNYGIDLVLKGGSIGDDTGLFLAYKESNYLKLTNVTAIMDDRLYLVTHGSQSFYLDDRTSNATIYNCTAINAYRAAMFHGGNNNRVERFRSLWCQRGVEFLPHFTTPNIAPIGNKLISYTVVN